MLSTSVYLYLKYAYIYRYIYYTINVVQCGRPVRKLFKTSPPPSGFLSSLNYLSSPPRMFANARNGFSQPLNGHRLFKIIFSPVRTTYIHPHIYKERERDSTDFALTHPSPPIVVATALAHRRLFSWVLLSGDEQLSLNIHMHISHSSLSPIHPCPARYTRRWWLRTGRTRLKIYCTNTLRRFQCIDDIFLPYRVVDRKFAKPS